jgi:hypothetical protein
LKVSHMHLHIHGPSTLEKQTLNLGWRSAICTFDPLGGRSILWALNLNVKSNMVYKAILYNSHTCTLYGVKVPQSGPLTWERKPCLNLGQRSTIWALNLGVKFNMVYIVILYNSHTCMYPICGQSSSKRTFDLGKKTLKVHQTHLGPARSKAHIMGLEPACNIIYQVQYHIYSNII